MTEESPLASTNPDALTRAFEGDPTTLTDPELDALILELRRRRNAFAAEEAAKGLAKKPKERPAPPLQDPSTAALRDKPATELSSADLFGDDE